MHVIKSKYRQNSNLFIVLFPLSTCLWDVRASVSPLVKCKYIHVYTFEKFETSAFINSQFLIQQTDGQQSMALLSPLTGFFSLINFLFNFLSFFEIINVRSAYPKRKISAWGNISCLIFLPIIIKGRVKLSC